jgi:hypothetical protein
VKIDKGVKRMQMGSSGVKPLEIVTIMSEDLDSNFEGSRFKSNFLVIFLQLKKNLNLFREVKNVVE